MQELKSRFRKLADNLIMIHTGLGIGLVGENEKYTSLLASDETLFAKHAMSICYRCMTLKPKTLSS